MAFRVQIRLELGGRGLQSHAQHLMEKVAYKIEIRSCTELLLPVYYLSLKKKDLHAYLSSLQLCLKSPNIFKITWMKSWKKFPKKICQTACCCFFFFLTTLFLFIQSHRSLIFLIFFFFACFLGPYKEHRAWADLPNLQGTVHSPAYPALPAQRLSQMCQRAAHAKPGRLVQHRRRIRVLKPWKPSVQSSLSQHGEAGQAGPIRCVPALSLNTRTHLTPEYEILFLGEMVFSPLVSMKQKMGRLFNFTCPLPGA